MFEIESEASSEFIIKVLKPKITTMTSADPGEPLVVYLGAAGDLVAPDGSQSSSSSSSSMRSFHESRAGGSACAPSSPACAVGGAESDCAPGPPRGLVLPPPCGCCGATTALVMQVCYTRKERHIISKTRDETREADQSSTDFHFLILHPPSPKKKQIHAPLLPAYPDRSLLFFACVSDGERCSRKQESWVAVRVQGLRAADEPCPSSRPEEAIPPPPPPPPPSAPVLPLPVVATDSWGLEDDSNTRGWGIAEDEAPEKKKNEKGNVNFLLLGSELSSAAEALQISCGRKPPKGRRPQRERGGGDDAARGQRKEEEARLPPLWTQPGESGPTLPSFYVSWAPEEEAGCSSSSGAAAQRKNKVCDPESSIDDAHVAGLLAKYEASERGESGSAAAAAARPSPSSSALAASTATPAEAAEALASSRLADSAGWSGEAYEPDSTPGASSAFLAFARKVARSPRQVARYYCRSRRGGSSDPSASAAASAAAAPSPRLLWPEAQGPPAPPPPCPRCGSAREYEAQLMAPLVALIDEAGQWEEEDEDWDEGGKGQEQQQQQQQQLQQLQQQQQQQQQQRLLRRRRGQPALRRAPETWEWLTVAMATCLAGCSGAGSDRGGDAAGVVVAVEEAVAVAFE
jgi:hypothetical protein